MNKSFETSIKKAVDAAFERGREHMILPEEIAAGLMPQLVQAVQREINSRFGPDGKLLKRFAEKYNRKAVANSGQ